MHSLFVKQDHQNYTLATDSILRPNMERQPLEECRLLPASFWLGSGSDVESLVSEDDLEAEAKEGCHLCQCLIAQLHRSYRKGQSGLRKITTRSWGIPLSPNDLVCFYLKVSCLTEIRMFGWYQKLFYDYEPLSNPECASGQLDEAAVG